MLAVRHPRGRRVRPERAARARDRLLTAWAMLHRLRSVLVCLGRERLIGRVQVDETYVGGEERGLRGGAPEGQESPRRDGYRGTRGQGLGPAPDADRGRWLGRVAAPVRHRS